MFTIFTEVGEKCLGAKCQWGKMSLGQNVCRPNDTKYGNLIYFILCCSKTHWAILTLDELTSLVGS